MSSIKHFIEDSIKKSEIDEFLRRSLTERGTEA